MNAVGDMKRRLETAVTNLVAAARASSGAARVDPGDLLAAAIADVAQHYGMASAPLALKAGLPLTNGRLPIEHASEAARRAGLDADVAAIAIAELMPHDLPVIVLMDQGGCDVLWALDADAETGAITATLSPAGRPMARVVLPVANIVQAPGQAVVRLRPISGLDERGAGALGKVPDGWFLPAFRGSGRIYGEAIAATLALNLLALALPLFTMNIYDRVLPNAVEVTLWALAIGVTLATIFDFAIKNLRATFVDVASRRADVRLSNFIYGRLLGARTPQKAVSAGVRANALREFETLREFFNSATLTAFGDVPFLVVFLGMIFVIAGHLGWIALLAVPVVLFIGWLTQKTLLKLSEESFREAAQKNAVVVETLVGLDSIKAAGAESWAATKWEQAVSEQIRSSHQIRRISNLGINSIFAVQTVTQIVMMVAGFYMVAAGNLTTGALIAATMLAGRALQPLGQIAMLISRLHQTRLAYRALNDIVMLEQERPDGQPLMTSVAMTGAVVCETMTYRYDPDAPASLDDVSFEVKAGERIGLVGAIGSGKTTLLKMIHAVHLPTHGRVLVDGVPVHQIDPAVLRSGIGLALQGADLFHGTIRSNISLADPGAPDDDILWAARAAGALDWILRLPKGFETPVRERGAGLSGGQRQSVALARALFKRPKIVLLDEPTSDMDLGTEQHVVRSLSVALKGRTLIVVSHRPAILALVDRLIVMDQGKRILDGPKEDVLRKIETMTAARSERLTQKQKPSAPRGGAA